MLSMAIQNGYVHSCFPSLHLHGPSVDEVSQKIYQMLKRFPGSGGLRLVAISCWLLKLDNMWMGFSTRSVDCSDEVRDDCVKSALGVMVNF